MSYSKATNGPIKRHNFDLLRVFLQRFINEQKMEKHRGCHHSYFVFLPHNDGQKSPY